jgi:hypothetical protein
MPPARKREPIVPAKVRAAVDYIYSTPGATLQFTAEHVGLNTRKLRYLMGLPHVMCWILQDKQVASNTAICFTPFPGFHAATSTNFRCRATPRSSNQLSQAAASFVPTTYATIPAMAKVLPTSVCPEGTCRCAAILQRR